MSDETEVGPTYLYKGDEARIFEGAEVAEMQSKGWKDQPPKKRGPKPKDAE